MILERGKYIASLLYSLAVQFRFKPTAFGLGAQNCYSKFETSKSIRRTCLFVSIFAETLN